MLLLNTGILLFTSPVIIGQQSLDNSARNETGEEITPQRKCLEVDPHSQCPDKNIFFTLYSRRVGKEGVNISAPASSFPDIFKTTDAIKVVIHGIIVDYMTPELYDIKDGKRRDCVQHKCILKCSRRLINALKLVKARMPLPVTVNQSADIGYYVVQLRSA